MAEFLTVDDLTLFSPDIDSAKAQQMIDDATALAVLAAPCIDDVDFASAAAVRAILRGAILRWNDSGSGAVSAETVGPFSHTYDTRVERRGMFWPSEIVALQGLCAGGSSYTLNLMGPDYVDGYWSSTTEWTPL